MKVRRIRFVILAISMGIVFTTPPAVHGIGCPNGGAALNVMVNNPTTTTFTSGLTVSGNTTSGNVTCTGQNSSYTLTINSSNHKLFPGANTFTIPALNAGMWVHHISVSMGSSDTYDQYQKGVVLEAPSATTSAVNWTYFPTAVKVFTTGDAYGRTAPCTTTCTLRQALYTAQTSSTGSMAPLLVWFSVSPGTMTQSVGLQVGNYYGYITVDGTDSNGNPWIVGDALAAAAGKQLSLIHI